MSSTNASAYLQEALTILRENSFYRATIDWPTLEAQTWQQAEGAQQPEDVYPAIEFAIQQLNDGHSFFWPPAKVRAIQTGAEDSRNRQPTGCLIASDIAYLHVPDFMGSAAATPVYARTLQQIIAELDATGPAGWIVDLTDNTGGNLFPMIVGLGPLFDTEEIGAFIDANGTRIVWRYSAGQFIVGEGVCLAIAPPVVELQHRPARVAVLIGPSTGSSGEMVAVALRGQKHTRSFGQPTEGLTTANAPFDLSDGAQLLLTIAISADRTGQSYRTALLPDETIEGSAKTLQTAACAWLRHI
ncbi:MAG: S41 family peptidase [Caldilineaceae bacterium]